MSDYVLRIGDTEYRAQVKEMTADRARIVVNGVEYEVDLVQIGRRESAPAPAPTIPPAPRAAAAPPPSSSAPNRVAAARSHGPVTAPLPGLVLRLQVQEGQAVQAGQPLLVMEAMKMENAVPAPHTGTVRRLFVAEGDTVSEGDPLVEIARPEMTTL